jgi:hypothetical protein
MVSGRFVLVLVVVLESWAWSDGVMECWSVGVME